MTGPYPFEVDYIEQVADDRNPLELARFIETHGANRLTEFEAQFVARIKRDGLVQISPRQFAVLVKIYHERA